MLWKLISFVAVAMTLLQVAWAGPQGRRDHANLVERKPDFDWPEVFGKDGRPTLEDLVQFRRQAFGSPDLSEDFIDTHRVLYGEGSDAFWNTLLAIVKCNVDREWIKSIFETVSKDERRVQVILFHRKDDKDQLQGYKSDVSLDEAPGYKEDSPLHWWPMLIAKAILDSPMKNDINDARKLLEMLTGFNAVSESTDDLDALNYVLDHADKNPVLYQYRIMYSEKVTEVFVGVDSVTKNVKVASVDSGSEDAVVDMGDDRDRWVKTLAPQIDSIVYIKDDRFTHFDGRPGGEPSDDPPPS